VISPRYLGKVGLARWRSHGRSRAQKAAAVTRRSGFIMEEQITAGAEPGVLRLQLGKY
jgi:hypothetical protein